MKPQSIVNFDRIAGLMTPEQLAEAIGARRGIGGWRCPLSENHRNGDQKPSLSFYRRGLRLLVKCHGSGCELHGSPVQVFALVWNCSQREAGLALSELIDLGAESREWPTRRQPGKQSAKRNGKGRKKQRPRGKVVRRYDYIDEHGELLYQVERLEPKNFRQRRPDGQGGWIYNLNGTRRVLYRLPQVIRAVRDRNPIHIVEGERDVEAIEHAGGIATTNPGGAGKWRAEFDEIFRGAEVRIVADRDDAGLNHALGIKEALIGIAKPVVVVQPAVGKDSSDHLSSGLGLEHFVPIEGGFTLIQFGPESEGNASS